jgi:peptidoglycan/LPS O-acetylase OafA/YrhL
MQFRPLPSDTQSNYSLRPVDECWLGSHCWPNVIVRRVSRIIPLYYAVLTIIVVPYRRLQRCSIGVGDRALAQIDRILINFLYLSNCAMAIYGSNYVPMNIAWSLAIEE